MMKYANYIIFALLLSLAFLFKEQINLSTNLLSLFASKESIDKINIASKLGYSKEMLIAVEGFDNDSKNRVNELSQKLKKIGGIRSVNSKISPSDELIEYYKKNYPLIASFDAKEQNQQLINKKLQDAYDAMSRDIFYVSIDKNDPLKLFTLAQTNTANISHKGGYLALGDFGYLMRISTDVSASDMTKAKILYEEVNSLLEEYEGIVAFAPFFYTVENSTKIKDDIKWIILLSSIVLIVIYYKFIRNIRLLSHTLITLASSMLFATLVSTLSYSNFNILSLAFGMSITAVSIDYLLHYYFHNFYQDKKIVDKNVLYGFLTTISAFSIFCFIPIAIIAQISYFAVLSLSFAYMIFTFVFPKLDIAKDTQSITIKSNQKQLSATSFFIISILLIGFTIYKISFDNNIRNLDYQNTKLKATEEFFKSSIKTDLKPYIVEAKSEEELISNLHLLHKKSSQSFSFASFVQDMKSCEDRRDLLEKYDFTKLNTMLNIEASKIGFRDSYFKDSYNFTQQLPKCEIADLEIFSSYNLYLYSDENGYYTIAFMDDGLDVDEFDFITSIDVKEMFSKQTDKMYRDLSLYSSLVIVTVFVFLFFSVREKFLYALNFILFPSSLVLATLSIFYTINIMHLFSLIILIAIGIDYGIYMSNTDKQAKTILAIRYSLLSTFAGFGVLIFSSIVALESIGMVISLGIVSIFLLIRSQK